MKPDSEGSVLRIHRTDSSSDEDGDLADLTQTDTAPPPAHEAPAVGAHATTFEASPGSIAEALQQYVREIGEGASAQPISSLSSDSTRSGGTPTKVGHHISASSAHDVHCKPIYTAGRLLTKITSPTPKPVTSVVSHTTTSRGTGSNVGRHFGASSADEVGYSKPKYPAGRLSTKKTSLTAKAAPQPISSVVSHPSTLPGTPSNVGHHLSGTTAGNVGYTKPKYPEGRLSSRKKGDTAKPNSSVGSDTTTAAGSGTNVGRHLSGTSQDNVPYCKPKYAPGRLSTKKMAAQPHLVRSASNVLLTQDNSPTMSTNSTNMPFVGNSPITHTEPLVLYPAGPSPSQVLKEVATLKMHAELFGEDMDDGIDSVQMPPKSPVNRKSTSDYFSMVSTLPSVISPVSSEDSSRRAITALFEGTDSSAGSGGGSPKPYKTSTPQHLSLEENVLHSVFKVPASPIMNISSSSGRSSNRSFGTPPNQQVPGGKQMCSRRTPTPLRGYDEGQANITPKMSVSTEGEEGYTSGEELPAQHRSRKYNVHCAGAPHVAVRGLSSRYNWVNSDALVQDSMDRAPSSSNTPPAHQPTRSINPGRKLRYNQVMTRTCCTGRETPKTSEQDTLPSNLLAEAMRSDSDISTIEVNIND